MLNALYLTAERLGVEVRYVEQGTSLWRAIKDASMLHYLDGGGVGCMNENEKPTDHRQLYHHFTFYGFMVGLCLDIRRDHLSLSWPRSALPLVRTAGAARYARRPRADRRATGTMLRDPVLQDKKKYGIDGAFLAMLFMTSLTGMALLLLRATPGHGSASAAHEPRVRAVHHHALRKVRARFLSLRGVGALREGSANCGIKVITELPAH
jgi:citrate/tricarballylate utilization protein